MIRLNAKVLIGICLITSATVIWGWPVSYPFSWRVTATAAAVVALVLAILVAEVVLVAAGFEGTSRWSHGRTKEAMRLMAGGGLYIALLLAGAGLLRRLESSPSPPPDRASAKARLTAALEGSRKGIREAAIVRRGVEEERAALVARMKDVGFRSAADAARSPTHARMAAELRDLSTQIATLEEAERRHAALSARIAASLRQLDREQQAASVAESAERLTELEASLAAIHSVGGQGRGSELIDDIELDALLDDTFSGTGASSAPRAAASAGTE